MPVDQISIYLTIVLCILRALQPPIPQNGLQGVLNRWTGPGSVDTVSSASFSGSVSPIPCHSHNDYERRVPLFQALSVGCISVEADLYLPDQSDNTTDILVSHKRNKADDTRTLRSLYTDPLLMILNAMNHSPRPTPDGVFTTAPLQPLILLLDFKETSSAALRLLWDCLQTHLDPLRSRGYLTHYSPENQTLIHRPLVIVASGALPFPFATDRTLNPHHDIFYDAPLAELFPSGPDRDSPYNISNSYTASSSLPAAVGNPRLLPSTHFSHEQVQTMETQIGQARQLGLTSRYWGTPAFPTGLRNHVWRELLGRGVGLVNVDEVEVFKRWEWDGRGGQLVEWCWLLGGIVGGVCR